MKNDFKLLHEYPLFSELDAEQMQAILKICREECFVPGATLFAEGQPASELFVLVEGEVEESFKAGEALLSPLHPTGPGEIIGCPALVPPYTHRCTARSVAETEVLAINATELRKLFAQDCRLAVSIQQHIIESLLQRIGKLRLAGTEYA